jgi:superfamily I DNA/RNA helicase
MAQFVPSPQQQAVFDFATNGKGSGIVEAVAGSGKTTTLLHMLELLQGSVAFCAYNKKIADEIKDRMATMGIGRNVSAGTFHSFGYKAMLKAFGKVPLDEKKSMQLAEQINMPLPLRNFAVKGVSLAKQAGVGFLTPFDDLSQWNYFVDHFELDETLATEGAGPLDVDQMISDGIDWSIRLLRAGVDANSKLIDFDDMIYGPLIHDLKMWENDWVLIDEAQDTNNSRRALAKKMLRAGGRLIAVGDRHQAIYGFTGANHDSLDIIGREFNCSYLPLTITYRCPKAVVRHAKQWVNHIEAAPTAPEGAVREMMEPEFRKLDRDSLGPESAVLCRNTKPLVSLAFHFIRRGIPCHVEGKEIGKGLLVLVNKYKTTDLTVLRAKLEEYLDRERQRLLAKGQEQRADALSDRVETLFVMMDTVETVGDLRERLNTMFDDTYGQPKRLTLSTIHKAKGREWERVYWFGRNLYQPSKYARQDWQMGQEINLMYVAATRAKSELVEVVGL